MNEKELEQFVELLYPHFLKKLKQENSFKTDVKSKNATVVSVASGDGAPNTVVKVKLPYDTVEFDVVNKTNEQLKVNDTVCLFYWVDLKNAVVQYKVN